MKVGETDDYVDDDLDHIDTQSDFFYNIDLVEAAVNPGSFAKLTLLAIALRAFELPH